MKREEEVDGSKIKWINDTHEARRQAIEVRRQIPAEMVQCPPFDVPDLVDFYNRLVHEYATQLRPKAEEVSDLWNEELCRVQVPKSNEVVDGGTTDVFGEYAGVDPIHQVEWESRPVSLDELAMWREKNIVRYKVRVTDPAKGEDAWMEQKLLYLPVYAADRALDQLNKCLGELGWLPESTMGDVTSEVLG